MEPENTMPLKPETATRKDRNATPVKMQHRHYATIAQIIADMPIYQRHVVAEHFATKLKDTNPAFNRDRFIAACEPED
jgi:hypothetical protein